MNTHKKAVPEATGTAYEVTEGKQAIDNKSHTSTSTKARLAAIVANPIYQALAFLLVILIAGGA